MAEPNPDTLNQLVGKMLGDLGGAFSVPTVRIGIRLGLFDSLHADGAATSSELADRLDLAERYVREWAMAQAANGYIEFDPKTQRFSLSPEQAMVFAIKDSPLYLEGAFDLAAAMIEGEAKVEQAQADADAHRRHAEGAAQVAQHLADQLIEGVWIGLGHVALLRLQESRFSRAEINERVRRPDAFLF